MNFEDMDLKKLVNENSSPDKQVEQSDKNSPEELSQQDKEILSNVAENNALMDAYEKDPSIATKTTTVDFANVRPGPPATPENVERVKQGLPPLYPDGTPYYPPGQEPSQPQESLNSQAEEKTVKPKLPERPTSGIIIENQNKEDKPEDYPTDIPPESWEHIQEYLENMEKDFEESTEIRKMVAQIDPSVASADEVKELYGDKKAQEIQQQYQLINGVEQTEEEKKQEQKEESIVEETEDSREATKERLKRFEEAIVSIDKVNADKLEFTDEERAKLEVVDKIKLEEVEVVDVTKIRRRKAKTNAVDTLIKRIGNTTRTFNMIMPCSGYVATVTGCSLHELMNLTTETNDKVQEHLMKWSVIHSKLVTTSIGEMSDFDYFMKHTANDDMEAFVYAIMVASLPANDTITLICNEDACKLPNGEQREYQHRYNVRSLLRVEEFDDEMIERLNKIATASTTKEEAMRVHMESDVMKSTGVRLPDSGIIVDIHIPSAYDFLERTLKPVVDNDEIKPEYANAAVLSTRVNSILIEDPKEGYIEITDTLGIIKTIYSLPPRDTVILERMIQKYTSNKSFTFGFVDVECPHCNHHTEVLPMKASDLLFLRGVKVTETIVE